MALTQVVGSAIANTTVSLNNLTAAAQYLAFKNRLINGAMMFDQRNAGAAVTVNSTTAAYSVDRFFGVGQSSDGVFTLQRSTTTATGFVNSVVATVSTIDNSLSASQSYFVAQRIEGTNIADLGWGTASAATVTLSFWVRSSVTGTFGGALRNASTNRSYPFTYTINSANTFEYKTITIDGDTSGTWGTDTGTGIEVDWSLGAGSTVSGTAGAWAGSNYISATSATNLMATLSATWYLAGAQLEKGSVATSFDWRPHGQELALCQRYFETGTGYQHVRCPSIHDNHPFTSLVGTNFQTAKRANPTITLGTATTTLCYTNSGSTHNINTQSFAQALLCQTGGAESNMTITQPWTASSEL